MEKDSKKKSKYLEQYFDFVGKEGQPIQDPSHEVLKRYRAEISSADALARRRRRFDLRLIYTSKNASTVYYIVDLGRFRMTISILNLQGKSPTAIGGTKMGSGSFGTVLVKNVANTEFVAKIIVLQRKTPDELEEIVLEVAISKLCAMFGISPDVETSIPYDLIVYEDAAQFHLEKCKTLCNWGEQFTAKTKGEKNIVIANLIDCLRVLHSLHIAHRDIKPSNALYCQRLNRYVICDFGVARYVYEAIGQTSRTNCCGSRRFMGPEMAELYDNKKSQIRVDLYYNDVVACEQLVRILYEPTRWMEEGSDKSFRKVEDDSFPQAYSESSQENRKISKKQPPLEPEPPKILPAFQKPDSYEFYRIHYAATAFGEHEFNLKENLHRLTEEQQAYIHGILGQSLNRSKMEQVLRQLWDLKPEVGTLQKKWLDDFVAAYRKNFDRHQPLFAQMPPLSREWVNNLTRLLGKNQQLRMIQQLDEEGLSQLDEQQLQEVYQAIVYEIKKKRWKRLYDQIFFLKASEQQDITIAWATVVQGLFSYDTKESMINDLFKSIQDNTISDQRLLHCLAAIVKKDSKASDLLYQFVQTEQPLERCLMLCSIHYNTSMDKSVKMLAVCSQLLERLGKLPVQCWFLETINVLHTQFRVKESRRELNHHDVRAHFEKSLRLLARHSSHQDAGSIHFILAEQLLYFQQFQFTQQDIRDTHIEFEQCRQFYSGMEKIDMDRQVMDTYIQQPMWAPQNMTTRNQRDYQRVQLQHQLELLKDQGRLREALEFQRKKTALMRHQLLQDGFDGDAPHILSGVIHEAIILSNIGRPQQAYDLLLSIDDRVASSSMLRIHEYYYFAKANASNWLGRHHEALNCCEKAISFNNELSPSSTQQTQAYKLRELQAKIYGSLGQYENSLKVLSELRGMLLANGRPHSYRNLAENYSSAAEVYRGMKRFHDGTAFCQKVFQLEQRGLIYPHVSAFAHSVVAKIYEQQRQVNKSLEECWNFLERTNALGNENFCIMYTLILRSCEEAVGSEALSFISYARKFTDPPRQTLRGNYIAEELYLSPVPTGLLPLDMPTAEFLKLAESSLRTLSVPQHFCCSQFKKQLLRVMPGKFRQLPQFRLIYVQTLAEIALHNSIGWEGKDLLKQLDYVVEQMLECEVAEIDQDSKQLLVECILERSDAVKNAMAVQKMLPACPASYKRRADAKRAH